MARRRGRGKVVVDLVETPGAATPGEDADVALDGMPPPAPVAGMTRRQRTVQAAVAIGVLVVVGGGLGIASGAREHARVERLRGAPGGVLSLDHPPRPAWTVKGDLSQPVQLLPGVVVQQRSDEIVGLDADSGAERWRVPFQGGYATCGVWNGSGVQPVSDRLVCLHSVDDDAAARPVADEPAWSVVVLDSSGVVATREVTGPFDAVWPTVDGGLITVRLTGQDPAPVPITSDGAGGWTAAPVEHGYDAQVHAEDAVTGESRWDTSVPFQPVEDGVSAAWACFADQPDGTRRFRPKTLSVWGDAATFLVSGCGLQGTLTLDGTLLDDSDTSEQTDPSAQLVTYGVYADGGILGVRYDGTGYLGVGGSVLHDASGATVQRLDDLLLSPLATDGTGTDVRVVEAGTTRLKAFGADGSPLWESSVSASSLLVRAGGVAVVGDQHGTVDGLDLATGATLWTSTGLLGSQGSGVSAFTDGTTTLLATIPYDARSTTVPLVALDLRTGEVRWRGELQGAQTQLVAAQGRLLQVVPTDITWETTEYGTSATPHGQELSLLR